MVKSVTDAWLWGFLDGVGFGKKISAEDPERKFSPPKKRSCNIRSCQKEVYALDFHCGKQAARSRSPTAGQNISWSLPLKEQYSEERRSHHSPSMSDLIHNGRYCTSDAFFRLFSSAQMERTRAGS